MDLLQGVNYLYTSNGQQVGPIEGTQVVLLAQEGVILATDTLWCEGMSEWVPAAGFNQLAPIYVAQQQASAPAQQPDPGIQVVQKPTLTKPGVIMISRDQEIPKRYRKRANFRVLMDSIVMLFVCIGAILWGVYLNPDKDATSLELSGLPKILVVGGGIGVAICLLVYTIVSYLYIYRAWSHIQELGTARTTPGKAVGFFFIPLFNVYWFFVAYIGWTVDFNRYIEEMGANQVRRASTGFAITHCIVGFLIGGILHPFMMAMMCRGINDVSELPDPVDLGLVPAVE